MNNVEQEREIERLTALLRAAESQVERQRHRLNELEAELGATQKRELRLLTVIEGVFESVAMLEPVYDDRRTIVDFRYVIVNTVGASRLGQTSETLRGRLVSEFLPRPLAEQRIRTFSQVLARGEPLREERFVSIPGQPDRWLHIRSFPYEGAIVVASQDVSELKSATHRHLEMMEFLDSLIENIPACVFVKDAKTLRLVRCSRRAEEMLGIRTADIANRATSDLFPKEHAEAYEAGDIFVRDTGKMRVDERCHETPLGKLWLQTKKVLLRDAEGHPQYILGIASDITAEKKAEASLRGFETLFRTSPTGIVISEPNGVIVDANASATRLLGYSLEELMGRTTTELGILRLPDRQQMFKSLGDADPYVEGDVRITTKAGETRDVILSMERLKTEKGVQYIKTFLDITERKAAEGSAHRAFETLATVNRDLETLLHIASHDLKEPLRAIDNFSRIVRDRYASQLDAKAKDYLSRTVAAAERLRRLLDEVLDLSMARKAETDGVPVSSMEIVDDAVSALDQMIRKGGATVKVVGEFSTLRANKTWATQALYNLIANALKFTGGGGPAEVEIRACGPDERLPTERGFVVGDRGPGVPADQREKIFQLFRRGVGREVEGTGAGLAIVQQVAMRHGGRAWVRPRNGGGSEFFLTFGGNPAERRSSAFPPPALDDAADGLGKVS